MPELLRPLLVEISIPYCIRPEKYRTGLQLMGSNDEKNAYLAAVKRELLSYEGSLDGCEVQALRLSGGSATVMSPDLLGDLLKTAREVLPIARGAECSVDAQPLTIGTPALTGIAAGHPNRMELMMHSANDAELRALGCSHTAQDVNNALRFFGRFRLNNVGLTVDIGIPGQTEGSWENTLRACTIIRPAHITLEMLNTEGEEGAPERAVRRRMVQTACAVLKEAGYLRYAAGCFCLPHAASRFEMARTDGAESLGLGLGAHTLFDGYLTRNTDNLNIYLSCAGDYGKTTAELYSVTPEVAMEYYVQGRLETVEGLSEERFQARFGCALPDRLRETLKTRILDGLLEERDGNFIPTEEGLFRRL